ncbi:FadR/GntR family transcriptional regulator [Pararhizobium haloflavum]|uniref:FadR/GntR family transcriptional regulator n=1 Tax=Pararhizobium haloflavum TaxID=2037914 RepID=UPI000C1966E1|nr:FCD domain-containing protein [Pararhizobium haloflavum]
MARRSSDDIAALLRKDISAGTWAETGRLPTERDLAVDYDVARNTVRRAFDRLEEEGILTRHVGRGTYINTARRDPLADITARMLGASPADMMEIRMLLEPAAAAFAATNASASQLSAIEKAHEKANAAGDMPEFEHWDTELHQLVFECSRNDLLREIHNILRVLRNQPPWFEMKKRSFSDERRQHYCEEHDRLVVALRSRLPEEAERAMRAHLVTVQKNMLGR